MKFKVGDRVHVRKDSKYNHGKYATAIGTVLCIFGGDLHPYGVEFDKVYHLANWDFHANELEAA